MTSGTGWPLRTLGEMSESIVYGYTDSATSEPVGPRFLRITDIQDGAVNWNTVPFCRCESSDLKRFGLRRGDIVFARTGATTGKSFLIHECPESAVFASYLIRVRPNSSVDPGYLARFFETPAYWSQITQTSSGTAQPGVNASKLERLQVPLPPMEEQKRIAAVLDKADDLRGKRRQALATLETLLQSVFLDMFGDPVTNPKKWPKMMFEDVAPSRLGKMLDAKQQTGDHGRPYLRNISVQWDRFDLSNVQTMDFDGDDREEFMLKAGDLMICEGGEPGRCAIWRDELPECYFQKAIHRARPHPTKATPEYLLYLMWSLADRGGFKDHVTVATIAHLTGEKLKRMLVPVPPVALQRKFADMYAKVRARRTLLASAEAAADTLFAALQSAAFAGTLFNGEMVKAAAPKSARTITRPAAV